MGLEGYKSADLFETRTTSRLKDFTLLPVPKEKNVKNRSFRGSWTLTFNITMDLNHNLDDHREAVQYKSRNTAIMS